LILVVVVVVGAAAAAAAFEGCSQSKGKHVSPETCGPGESLLVQKMPPE